MSKQAIVVVDIQNDYFPGGLWTLQGAEAAADQAARVIAGAREAGDLVVHIRHEFPSSEAPFFVPGSPGADIHPKVRNQGAEPVVLKNFVNSFRQTELKPLLDSHGIEEVVIVGNMSHMCVDAVTRAAVDYGYKATVIHDACASRDLEFNGVVVPAEQAHAAFMAALAFAYANVVSTDEYLGTSRRGE